MLCCVASRGHVILEKVTLTIELDREADGRWIAKVSELPGVMSHGQTRDEAIRNAEGLALEAIIGLAAAGQFHPFALDVSFAVPAEHFTRQ